MRIISGIYGGRRLDTPKGSAIRPTSDKIRGAIFNMLLVHVDLENARVLDICCGTGALGLESLSRGAAHVLFIDKARASLDLARSNAKALGAEADFMQQDAIKIGACEGEPYDLLFLDPPYNQALAPAILQALIDGGWLSDDAICVVETEAAHPPIPIDSLAQLQHKIYGDTAMHVLRYNF